MPEPSPRRSGNERPMAFAVAPGRDGASLLAELRGLIEPAFLPRRIQLVDRLPRNEIGKLPREALLALAAQVGRR
jgi:acyl-coenzyme A synthetase/AMP-(fatty) acid ligase